MKHTIFRIAASMLIGGRFDLPPRSLTDKSSFSRILRARPDRVNRDGSYCLENQLRLRRPAAWEEQVGSLLVVQFGKRSPLPEQVVQTRTPLHQAPRALGARGRAGRGLQVAQQ